jgi:type I restriction enzyme R subunit
MVKDILEKIKLEKPIFAPHFVWNAFQEVEKTKVTMPKSELVAFVSLIRRTIGIDSQLTPYSQTVDRNFQEWTFKKQAGTLKFNSEQMEWLRLLKEHIATSFHVTLDDLDYTPFDAQGGKGKMYQLFGNEMNQIITELNQALVA